ncbi:MAG: hypothetical protein ACFFDN_34400, partial [Candidatus Hodarchaeota archaeon]
SQFKRLLLSKFCITQLIILIFYVIVMLPYVIGVSINLGWSVFSVIFYYFPVISLYDVFFKKAPIFGPFFRDIGKIVKDRSLYYFIDQFLILIFGPTPLLGYYTHTIQIGIFLVIASLFLNFKKYYKYNKEQNNLINYSKFTFILIFLFWLLFIFSYYIEISIFQNIFNFLNLYQVRLFELFSGFWAILFVLTFNYVILSIKKKYYDAKYRKIPPKIVNKAFKACFVMSIITVSGFLYLANFGSIIHGKRYDNYRTEAVLYAGDYFNTNPLFEKKKIMLENLDNNHIYGLIVNSNLEKQYCNFPYDLEYSKFRKAFILFNCQFILFNVSNLRVTFRIKFFKDFEIIHANSKGMIFAKIME